MRNNMEYRVPDDWLKKIVNFECHDPFYVLGAHVVSDQKFKAVVIRSMNPAAKELWVVDSMSNKEYRMEKIHETGFFEILIEERTDLFSYTLKAEYYDGRTQVFIDPYCFLPVITEFDRHLFNKGSHQEAYKKLGAHIMELGGVKGVHFAVWAPNAKAVSVIGDFNGWDNRRHQMRVLGGSGIWEIFIPDLMEGDIYKYAIKTKFDQVLEKADPYGYFSEIRPKTGSMIWNINKYKWEDAEWIDKRKKSRNLEKPLSIYEVHLGSWMRVPEENNRFLNYRELAVKLTDYVIEMGFTFVELMAVLEHPFEGSWGYQVTGYYAPTSRYGTPEDFMYFVDYLHQHNIGVIVDWVPGHFPKDAHGLAKFDGSALYEHADPRKGEHKEWGTKVFNFSRHEVRNFLISNLLFWLDKYHIDGFRADAVASMLYLDYDRKEGEWIPNRYGGRENLEAIHFMKQMNILVYNKFPGAMTIAEESTAFRGVSRPPYMGGLGFEFKWNMGWMHDTLDFFGKDPVYRKYHQGTITFSMIYAYNENFILVLSHDEVVHGKGSLISKMPGDNWQKFANLRLLYTYMWTHPGKKLLFMGQEFGQWGEWNEERSLDWHLLGYEPHRKLQKMVKDLNNIYKNEPSLYEIDFKPAGFEWIDLYDSDNSIISYTRKSKAGDMLIIVINFTPVVRRNYRIGINIPGVYEEIFNSDSGEYWGSGIGNPGGIQSDDIPWRGRLHSLNITLPPLGGLIFKPLKISERAKTLEKEEAKSRERVKNAYFIEDHGIAGAAETQSSSQAKEKGRAEMSEVFDYIKNSWTSLNRSCLNPESLVDEKVGTAILYLPEGEKNVQANLNVRYLPSRDKFDKIETTGLLYLPNDYIVPGGRFNEMYGWDSYFISMGLINDGHVDKAKGMCENQFYEIEHYGRILNANRTYYLDRSSPPFLSSNVLAVYEKTGDKEFLRKGLKYCIKEYNEVWTKPRNEKEIDHLTPTGLSRYYSPLTKKCPEVEPGYYDDPPTDDPEFCQHDRAERESGWDMADRFGYKCSDYNPVDLNSLLYKYEKDIAKMHEILDGKDSPEIAKWEEKAQNRKELINKYMWNEEKGMFFDYNFKEGKQSDYKSLATFYPLWAGLCDKHQAEKIASCLKDFEHKGGLSVSDHESGKQWDYPYGWAPHHILVEKGLRNYGFGKDADRISVKFINTVRDNFSKDGGIMEKYNVADGSSDAGVGYGNQVGFGWTNASITEMYKDLTPEGKKELM